MAAQNNPGTTSNPSQTQISTQLLLSIVDFNQYYFYWPTSSYFLQIIIDKQWNAHISRMVINMAEHC